MCEVLGITRVVLADSTGMMRPRKTDNQQNGGLGHQQFHNPHQPHRCDERWCVCVCGQLPSFGRKWLVVLVFSLYKVWFVLLLSFTSVKSAGGCPGVLDQLLMHVVGLLDLCVDLEQAFLEIGHRCVCRHAHAHAHTITRIEQHTALSEEIVEACHAGIGWAR